MIDYHSIPIGYAIAFMSVLCFLMFWWDKKQAGNGGWRLPEANLLLAALLGGWLGGYVAMRFLRHKTQKTSFRIKFFLMTFFNIALLAYYMNRS